MPHLNFFEEVAKYLEESILLMVLLSLQEVAFLVFIEGYVSLLAKFHQRSQCLTVANSNAEWIRWNSEGFLRLSVLLTPEWAERL